MATARTCSETGLRLLPDAGEQTFRVAKPKYGLLSAPLRSGRSARRRWGRYDSYGRTLYLASDEETAFAEVLSVFKRRLGAADPVEKDAAALGLTREEFLEIAAAEWQESSCMGIGAVPRQWRTERRMFRVETAGSGTLIDVEHPDSIAAIEPRVEGVLARHGIRALTTAVLRGDDRIVTTAIALSLRRITVDDGSVPQGIHFGSKWGGGWCRAVWLPGDEDEWSTDLRSLSGEDILATDEHLIRASERFRVRVF
ncbi:RES family NAD+ phosphorylase [Rathayibacter festucae]|uniref:RES domain-containing protein n=1 Tax=Rathayibacter festucae TaxID=110937 RepID=UPI001FB1CEC9|nr:RES domain-containing protein [Rathayibacter festucae]MCJ1698396.1 RES family NAD+ phosphorylase [Rathayibacter festucae]